MTIVLCLLSAAAGAAAGGLWFRRREKRTLKKVEAMLEEAARGEYRPDRLDESLLSAVEHRMADYLDASTVSARHLREEKETIKTLIGDISHQTKTPIANLLLYAQLLAEQPLPPEGRACAAALEEQARKLSTLIRRWSRPPGWRAGSWPSTRSCLRWPPCWRVRWRSWDPRRRRRGSS